MGAAARAALIKDYLALVHCTGGFASVEDAERVTRFENGRYVILGLDGQEQRLTTAQFKREIERLQTQLRDVGGVLSIED